MAEIYDFPVDQGATHSFTLTYTDSAGDPIDLSGHTVKMEVRKGFKDSALAFTLANGSGVDMTNAATGVLLVTMSAAQTGALEDDVYRYDLEVTLSGVVTRLVQGEITVNREVTD